MSDNIYAHSQLLGFCSPEKGNVHRQLPWRVCFEREEMGRVFTRWHLLELKPRWRLALMEAVVVLSPSYSHPSLRT